MHFQTLPQEVVAKILDIVRLIEPHKVDFLNQRLVCRRFDDQISRLVLKHAEPLALDIGRRHNWRPGIEWMLITKARIHFRDYVGPFAFLHDAAAYLAAKNLIPNLTHDDALVAACRAVVSAHDPSWIVNHLVTWKLSSTLPKSIWPLASYTSKRLNPAWRPVSEVDTNIQLGTLQVLLAHGNALAIEHFIRSCGLSKRDMEFVHLAFGSVLSAAIVFARDVAIFTLLEVYGIDTTVMTVDGKSTNGLLYACEMNRSTAAYMLLEVPRDVQVNFQDALGHSALNWAARRGWVEVAEALLARDDINLNIATKWGETPMGAAARQDHVEIVRLLLDKTGGKPPMVYSRYSPMWLAFECGSTNVVRLFLERLGTDFQVNQVMRKGFTPLTLAASKGYTPIVRMLLAFPDIDPDKPMDRQTFTPLLLACENGHIEIVRMLLDRGADVTRKGFGRLPFQLAMDNGHTDVFALLIDSTIESNDEARTALLWSAVERRREIGIIERLLASPQFRRNRGDQLGRILVHSVAHGLVDIVRELLLHKEVDPNFIRGFPSDKTPLLRAIYSPAATDLIPLLLAREDVDVNKVTSGGTALASAAARNALPAIAALLKYPGIDVNFCPTQSKGANRHLRLNQPRNFFPSRKAPFKSYLKDNVYRQEPPLLVAATENNIEAVKLLCEDPRVDLGIKDSFGRTALWWAVRHANRKMAVLILDFPRMTEETVNAQDEDGWTALHVAANYGLHRIVEKLLERPDIDPNMRISNGWTALHMSAGNCNKNVTRMLLGHPKIDPTIKLDDGLTPFGLHEGCDCGLQSMDPEGVKEYDLEQELSNNDASDEREDMDISN
ncbi:unnamed protein product [Clonostachys chloroleuca]|uniref:Uncharacterized protein n=1 Tax=Clonostachys chloroleuca TaxID=1926264 RepID=A0AA35LV29_9HYPO|nr:unnamed protein product [Clonostachys chloroleuca]